MSNLNVSELITKLNLTCAAGAEGLYRADKRLLHR